MYYLGIDILAWKKINFFFHNDQCLAESFCNLVVQRVTPHLLNYLSLLSANWQVGRRPAVWQRRMDWESKAEAMPLARHARCVPIPCIIVARWMPEPFILGGINVIDADNVHQPLILP